MRSLIARAARPVPAGGPVGAEMASSIQGGAGAAGGPSVNGSFAADVSAFSGFEVPGADTDPDPSMSGGFW